MGMDTSTDMRCNSVSFAQFDQWYSKSTLLDEKCQQSEQLKEQHNIDVPGNSTWSSLFVYALTYPTCAALYITMPDIQKPKNHGNVKMLIASFALSLLWLFFLSCCLLEWTMVVSNTVGIPAPVAGVTLLAAGTSVPDLLSSYIV